MSRFESQDFKLVMRALAEQRDTLRQCFDRLENSSLALEQRLERYQNTSLQLVDNLDQKIESELDAIRLRLDRLENPPAA